MLTHITLIALTLVSSHLYCAQKKSYLEPHQLAAVMLHTAEKIPTPTTTNPQPEGWAVHCFNPNSFFAALDAQRAREEQVIKLPQINNSQQPVRKKYQREKYPEVQELIRLQVCESAFSPWAHEDSRAGWTTPPPIIDISKKQTEISPQKLTPAEQRAHGRNIKLTEWARRKHDEREDAQTVAHTIDYLKTEIQKARLTAHSKYTEHAEKERNRRVTIVHQTLLSWVLSPAYRKK